MKRQLLFAFICVFFVCVAFSFLPNTKLFACQDYTANINEQINFTYKNKTFSYLLKPNVKKCDVFSVDYQINKYNRFGTKTDRKHLLEKMTNLGFDADIALNYIFPNLNKTVDKIEKNIKILPKNAILTVNANSQKVFDITPERKGRVLDRFKLYNRLLNAYLDDELLEIDVPIIELDPTIFEADLKAFTYLRGDFSTSIASSSADRKHNIKNALNSLNLYEIMPGEVFSFNNVIGKRTEKNGYRNAKIIVNNEFVDGLGGGVCQVSSTLYNTALLAGLKIIEANKHSKQVAYVNYGFDAMVNFGSSDLKFQNTTEQKLTIITNYNTKNIRIRIFGQSLGGVEYRLVNEIISTTPAPVVEKFDESGEFLDKVQFEDESFVLKNGCQGMEVKSYRQKYVNGQLVDNQLLRFDKFKAQDKIIVFGNEKRPQNLNLESLLFD